MKIPKTIQVVNKEWRVEYKWNLRYDGHKCDGLCCHETRTIFIDRSLSKQEKEETFLHEYLHAIIAELGIKRKSLPIVLEELLVESLSQEIYEKFKLRLR